MTTQLKENYKAVLKQGICEMVFTKADGSDREMTCTLHSSRLPPEPEANPDAPVKVKAPEPDTVVTVWDVDAEGWRRFIIANVTQAPLLIEALEPKRLNFSLLSIEGKHIMPNHITNKLTITGHGPLVEACVAKVGSSEDPTLDFDFNNIIKQPEVFPTNWRDWAMDNWGTKWNCYEVGEWDLEDGQAEIQFDTAWSTPAAAMIALSEQWPALTFRIEYADEDIGYNCGIYTLKAGMVEEEIEYSGKAAEDFALAIKGYDANDCFEKMN
jgi:hypothetical protein